MKSIRIILIASIFLFVAVIVIGMVFAWFITPAKRLIVVTSDVRISVEGWYDVVSNPSHREFTNDKKLSADNPNPFEDLPANQSVAFKFQVTNLEKQDATLSMRLSNMFDYIFSGLKTYIDKGGSMTQAEEDGFYLAAEKNNGRLSFILDNIYYEYEQNNVITYTSEQLNTSQEEPLYIWKLSRGERFIGGDGSEMLPGIPSILLPAVVKVGTTEYKTNVNIYMILSNKHMASAIEMYKKWFLGSAEVAGTGQEYGANLFGYTWEKLTDGTMLSPYDNYAEYINLYLEKFVSNEIQSIKQDEFADGSNFNLKLDYFEFIGENIPKFLLR